MGDDGFPNRPRLSDSGEADGACSSHLQGRDFARLIDEVDWHNDQQTPDFQQRLIAAHYRLPPLKERVPRSVVSARSDSSSMALTAGSRHAERSSRRYSYAPSLADSSSTITTQSSLRTTEIGSSLNRYPLDQRDDDMLELPGGQGVVPLQCQFSFLSCNEVFWSIEEWNRHCRAHFPPARVQACPFLYCDWEVEAVTGDAAWDERSGHIFAYHQSGDTVDPAIKPSPHLIDHLLREGVIKKPHKKELLQDGRLSGRTYTETASARREQRDRTRMLGESSTIRVRPR